MYTKWADEPGSGIYMYGISKSCLYNVDVVAIHKSSPINTSYPEDTSHSFETFPITEPSTLSHRPMHGVEKLHRHVMNGRPVCARSFTSETTLLAMIISNSEHG